MDKKTMERIFDPYFTTKGPKEGTGLGLAVVMGIIKGYGGTIFVQSKPGKGSCFDIYFPRTDVGNRLEPIQPATATLPMGKERILCVDDEHEMAITVKAMLEQLGYRVHIKTQSTEALLVFKAQPDQFDLVMTDMTMPVITGDTLSREILNIRSDIPIILYTGYSEKITKEKAKRIGIRGLLPKPLSIEVLSVKIREALDG